MGLEVKTDFQKLSNVPVAILTNFKLLRDLPSQETILQILQEQFMEFFLDRESMATDLNVDANNKRYIA
jgi:hypothetical protein